MPEVLGGGYPVQPAIIQDQSGNIISGEQPSLLEKGKEKLIVATEKAKETYKETMPEALGGRPATLEESAQPTLAERAKVTYRQTMPEALGGGYPVQPGIIKDSEHEFRSSLDEWRANQPSLIERAKQTAKETLPEALGGRPPAEGEKTLGVKAQEKLEQVKETVKTSAPSILGRVKHTLMETLPEMIGVKPATTEGTLEQTQGITGTMPDTKVKEVGLEKFEVRDDIPKVRVTEELRKVDMDRSGNVTQVETLQNVSRDIPVIPVTDIFVVSQSQNVTGMPVTDIPVTAMPVTDIPVTNPVTDIPATKAVFTQKVEDLPLNEQPVFDRPLADNYEFQGQSVPAPHLAQQKPVIPTPQVVTERDVQQQAFQH
jgi:hypothetical protein